MNRIAFILIAHCLMINTALSEITDNVRIEVYGIKSASLAEARESAGVSANLAVAEFCENQVHIDTTSCMELAAAEKNLHLKQQENWGSFLGGEDPCAEYSDGRWKNLKCKKKDGIYYIDKFIMSDINRTNVNKDVLELVPYTYQELMNVPYRSGTGQ